MNKLLNKKITILPFFLFLFLALLSFIFFDSNYNQNKVNAQEIVCDPQIPIGEAVEKTNELLEILYQNVKTIEVASDNQLNASYSGKDNIYSLAYQCRPYQEACWTICRPVCIRVCDKEGNCWCEWHCAPEALTCNGRPCPSFIVEADSGQINLFEEARDSYKEIEKSQKEIKKAVEEKSETIDPDILSSSELQILENSFNTIIQPIPGLGGFSSFSELFPHLYVDYKWAVDLIDSALGGIFKITKEEFIKRKLNKARLEFDRCHLTPLEWKMVEQGKLSPRYTTRCRTVLETNLSRKIDAVCETTCLLMGANSDECKKCTSCKSLLNYFCCQ